MTELEAIEQTLIEIYNKNMSYFNKENSVLYTKIKDFENIQKESYYIDFVDNHFELCKSDGTKIYNCDPFYDGGFRAKKLANENLFTLIQLAETKKRVHYDDSLNAYQDINEFINLYNSANLNINIYKFIFVGTLLGVHINDIDKVVQAKSYLIIEPNIEIFRLSLFFTDYESLAKSSKVFYCIDFDLQQFLFFVKSFLEYDYEKNTKIQFELASPNEADILHRLSIEISQNSQMTYPYSEYIVSMKRGYEYFKNGCNGILNITKLGDIFSDKPVLFIGAGVSVASHLEWIYLNQDKFIIVCASAILKRLELLSIVPDLILVIDGQKDVVLRQFEVNPVLYQNSIIFASIKIDKDLFHLIESRKTFYIQDSFELFEDFGILTGVTVGDIGISFLLKCGVENLYLLGFDACISPINHKTHDSLHKSSRKINLNHQGDTYDTHLVKVKGNFRDEVDTFIFYTGMIDNISNICKNNNKSKIFNLSDGAYFFNTIPTRKEDIKLEELQSFDKAYFQDKLLEKLSYFSKKVLTSKDIQYLKKEEKILGKLKQFKIENINQDLAKLRSSYLNSSVLQIVEKYLKLISPYSFYTNNKKIQEKQLRAIILQLEDIVKKSLL